MSPNGGLVKDGRCFGRRRRQLRRPLPDRSVFELNGDAVLGLEGIVSKRKGSPYLFGRSPDWLKMKNPDAPAMKASQAGAPVPAPSTRQ
jgi:hypothetical protein